MDDEAGMVHVCDDAEGFALRFVFVAGVEVAEFVDAGGDVGQTRKPCEQAGADMAFVARGGRARGDGHQGLVEFFVEDVGHDRIHLSANISSAGITLYSVISEKRNIPCFMEFFKGVFSMKVTRKLQSQFEVKVKHALTQSQPLMIPRPTIARIQPKAAVDKTEENATGHSK
jgi:hypothetical protein